MSSATFGADTVWATYFPDISKQFCLRLVVFGSAKLQNSWRGLILSGWAGARGGFSGHYGLAPILMMCSIVL